MEIWDDMLWKVLFGKLKEKKFNISFEMQVFHTDMSKLTTGTEFGISEVNRLTCKIH